MALYVKDDRARQLAETLAGRLGKTKSDVVVAALQEKLDREARPVSVLESSKSSGLSIQCPRPPARLPTRRSLMNCLVNMNESNLAGAMRGLTSRVDNPGGDWAGATLRERMAAWRKRHPMPEPTGKIADKAFFDELSGDS